MLRVRLMLRSVSGPDEAGGGTLISFEETLVQADSCLPVKVSPGCCRGCGGGRNARLRQELADTREHLQAVTEVLS